MEAVMQRVRGVMSLLLIWALVLLWVATVKPVDIHHLCHDLEIKSSKLLSAARHGGKVVPLSIGGTQGPPLTATEEQLLKRLRHQWRVQSNLRFSSLHTLGKPEPHASAREYLAAYDRMLSTAWEGAEAKHPGLSSLEAQSLLDQIQRHISELRWHVQRLELQPNVTLFEVANEARPRVQIPGTGQSIPMAGGVAMSIIGLAGLYFYLVSLLRALRESFTEQPVGFGNELVFLHPGWLGPMLGAIWLTLPLVGIYFAAEIVFSHQSVDSVYKLPGYTIFLLPLSWAWSVIAALRTRLAASQISRESSQPVAQNIAELRLAKLADTGISLSQNRRAA